MVNSPLRLASLPVTQHTCGWEKIIMDDKNTFIWLLLFAVFAFCAWWHARENRQLSEQWKHNFDPDTAEWMVRFAWSRTMQLLLALACCTLIIIMYDMQLGETRKSLSASMESEQKDQQIIRTLANQLQTAQWPAPQPQPTAVATIPAPQPAANNPKATVDDVYNPEKKGTDNQSSMDDIKKRYEDILVLYMFLKKCNKATAEDYHIITSALGQEMASVNAPGRLQYDILTSAQGSYKEIYSKSSCSGNDVNAIYAQYTDYINVLSNNLPAQ